jgi:hypothetical protein
MTPTAPPDVFVRDLQMGDDHVGEHQPVWNGVGNDVSAGPEISADGRFVAFL